MSATTPDRSPEVAAARRPRVLEELRSVPATGNPDGPDAPTWQGEFYADLAMRMTDGPDR